MGTYICEPARNESLANSTERTVLYVRVVLREKSSHTRVVTQSPFSSDPCSSWLKAFSVHPFPCLSGQVPTSTVSTKSFGILTNNYSPLSIRVRLAVQTLDVYFKEVSEPN